MSYDVYLESPDQLETTGACNYTYNVQPILAILFGAVTEELRNAVGNAPLGIWCIDGQVGGSAKWMLTKAIERGELAFSGTAMNAALTALEPANGWGSLRGCLQWLRDIRSQCEEHQDWVVKIT